MSIPAGPQVDVYGIETRLRKEDKPAWQYIKALKKALESQQELTAKALGKVKEQAAEIRKWESNYRSW